MSEADRVRAAWDRIERWLVVHLPEAIDNLRGPASAAQLDDLESTLGVSLPAGLRTVLSLHDGEERNWPPGAFADGHWFLPCAQIREMFQQLVSIAREMGDHEDAYDSWKSLVEDGIIFVRGPVKPNFGSPKWIPFSSLDGHVQRFLDFDPAPGGTEAQVIEVDPESCTYQVIAPSFADFLEGYAGALEQGDFRIESDCVTSANEGQSDPTGWLTPEYLNAVSYEEPDPAAPSEHPMPETLGPNDVVTLEGAMGTLMGGPETVFSLETGSGRAFTFLATSRLTKGYRKIAVQQRARVRARPYTSATKSVFADAGMADPPDFIAIEYTMLRDPDGS